jgi:hypothetical protein
VEEFRKRLGFGKVGQHALGNPVVCCGILIQRARPGFHGDEHQLFYEVLSDKELM